MVAWRPAVVSVFLWALSSGAGSAQTLRAVDAAHSQAHFSVTHVYVASVTGSIPIVEGSVVLPDASAIPTRASATLDARRVDTGNGDRDDDLQGPDWFDTRRYPTWPFASTSIVPGSANTFVLNGTLTVHGVPQPVTLQVTVVRGLPNPLYHAVGKVDRHAFGMQITPMDPLIGGDVELVLDIALTR